MYSPSSRPRSRPRLSSPNSAAQTTPRHASAEVEASDHAAPSPDHIARLPVPLRATATTRPNSGAKASADHTRAGTSAAVE